MILWSEDIFCDKIIRQNYICWARGWHFRSEKINVFFSSFIFTDHLTDNNQTVPDFFHIRPFSFLERWVLSGLQLGLIQNNLIFLFIIVRNFSVDINRKAFHTGFNFVKERERRTAARASFGIICELLPSLSCPEHQGRVFQHSMLSSNFGLE